MSSGSSVTQSGGNGEYGRASVKMTMVADKLSGPFPPKYISSSGRKPVFRTCPIVWKLFSRGFEL